MCLSSEPIPHLIPFFLGFYTTYIMLDHDSTSCFPHLNDTNYPQWALCMEAELIHKSLWNNVVEILVDTEGKADDDVKKEYETKLGKQSASKMAEAQADMILRVDGGQLSHMQLKVLEYQTLY